MTVGSVIDSHTPQLRALERRLSSIKLSYCLPRLMRNLPTFAVVVPLAALALTASACMGPGETIAVGQDGTVAVTEHDDSTPQVGTPDADAQPERTPPTTGETSETSQATSTPSTSPPETSATASTYAPDASTYIGTKTLWISAEWTECMTMIAVKCPKVAMAADEEPVGNPIHIEGFEIEEGTSYVVKVDVTELDNPPADASSLIYTFVELISSS